MSPNKLLFLPIYGIFSSVDNNGFVKINQGNLQGQVNSDHFAFYGIPYAKPPIGDLRWRKPENPENWTGTRDASTNNKPGCLQDPGHATAPSTISEDCLFLNIFMPKSAKTANLPVMFWIHGGSWKHGHGAANLYNGRHLAKKDVILVSINYRMGAMGFLYSKDTNSNISGNQAVWDMIKALEWVNSNIDQFYGDASKITIFGESAGGQSVATLLSLIERNGRNHLFSQAIIQSDPWGIPYKTFDQGDTETDVFMQELGCIVHKVGRKEYDWNCAKNKDSESLLLAQQATRGRFDTDMFSSAFEAWTPVIDNELLDSHPLDAIRAGRSSDKNIMIGHTTGEGAVFVYGIFGHKVGKIEYETFVNVLFSHDSDAVLKRYPSPCKTIDIGCDARDQLSQIAGSYLFDCPARHVIMPRSNQNFGSGETFHFIFDHPIKTGIFPEDSMFEPCERKSCHGAEVAFVFGSFEDLGVSVRPAETTLSNRMMDYWTNFAKNGNPNTNPVTKAMPCWYGYSSIASDFCGVGDTRPPHESMHLHSGEFDDTVDPDAINQHCVFWDSLDAYLKH